MVSVVKGWIANIDAEAPNDLLWFDTPAQIETGIGSPFVEAVCNFVNGFLQCNAGDDTIFEYCASYDPPGSALIVTTAVDPGCEQI
jgi:hypothetical protein